METFIKQNFVVAKFRKMTNRVLRYANANDLQEYRLVRGKLRLVKSYASVEEVRRKSFKCIILTPENYVRGSVVSDELKFVPDDGQFIFGTQSVIKADDVDYLPVVYDKDAQTFSQIWASKKRLLDIQKLFSKGTRLYPQEAVVGRQSGSDNDLDQAKFSTPKHHFLKTGSSKNNLFLVVVVAVCVSVSLYPWVKLERISATIPVQSFENKSTLDANFADLSNAINLPKVISLQFNFTLNRISLTFANELNDVTFGELSEYCEREECEISSLGKSVTVTYQNRGANG